MRLRRELNEERLKNAKKNFVHMKINIGVRGVAVVADWVMGDGWLAIVKMFNTYYVSSTWIHRLSKQESLTLRSYTEHWTGAVTGAVTVHVLC